MFTFKVIIAVLAGLTIWKAGRVMLGGLARPLPQPPPRVSCAR